MAKTNPSFSNSLRDKAEEILKSRQSSTGLPLSDSETSELIRELQLSQIELELQNQELLKSRELTGMNENGEEYRYMFENNPQPMWIYDLETLVFLEVNDAAIHHYGYSKDEFLAMTLKDIRPKEDIEALLQDVEKTMKTYNPSGQWRHLKKNGEIIFVDIISHTVTFNGRKARHVMVTDITERIQQEEKLFETEFRFTKLWENGPFGMMLVNQKFLYEKVNPAFCNMLGYSEDELLQLTFKDISNPEDLASDLPNIQKLINKEISVYKTEKRYIRKDGQQIWGALTVTSNYDNEGQFLYNLAIIEDITRRKLAEEELKKSKKLLSETESMGKVGGWEFNVDTMEQNWTEEVYRIHEVEMDFNPNVNEGINFYSDESRPIIEQAVERILIFGEPFDLELEIITAKGNLRKVHSIGKADFENRRIYGFFQDITDRKLAEEKLRENQVLLTQVLNSEPDSIFAVDLNYCLLINNQRHQEVLVETGGHQLRVGESIFADDYKQEVLDFWKGLYNRAFKGEVFKIELEWTYTDGLQHSTENNFAPLRDTSGNIIGALVLIHDITERKTAENEIKKLNERITTATKASQVGIWDWEIQNNRLTWDDQMYVLYGVKKDEFAGAYETWVNGLHPDDREFSTSQTQLALSGEKDYDTEFRVVWPNGTIRYCKAKGEVFRNEKGEPIRMLGVNYDITERILIEKELQESEEYLKLGYETANLGIWKNDLTTMTVEFDERARSHYGFEESVVMLSEVIARIHPDDMSRLVAEIEKATAPTGSGRYSTEYRVIHPDGTERWLHIGVRVIYGGEGEKRRSVMGFGTSLDITERKQREETLRKLEYVLSEGQKIAHVGTFEFIVETQTTNWSAEEYAIYGLDPGEPSPPYEIMLAKCIHPDDADLLHQTFSIALQSNSVYELEHRIIRPDGSIRWVFDRAKPYFDHSGKLVRYVGTTLDITERKQTEEDIRKLNEELEQRVLDRTAQLEAANKELEAFSYSVSHDLRAPLRHINGFVDLLNEKYTDLLPDKGKHYLSVITEASSQMGNLIDDLLQFSRTGRQEMQQMMLDMNSLIHEVVRFYADETNNRKISWEIGKLPTLKVDQSLLRMVWFNLIGNAIKFTRGKDYPQIKIGYTEEKKEYIFYVCDNGAGFDMRYVHKLFGVFQRLHTKQQFEGTGIGLANVQRIILKHGGRCWAESELNKGATFYFTIPKSEEN